MGVHLLHGRLSCWSPGRSRESGVHLLRGRLPCWSFLTLAVLYSFTLLFLSSVELEEHSQHSVWMIVLAFLSISLLYFSVVAPEIIMPMFYLSQSPGLSSRNFIVLSRRCRFHVHGEFML